MNGPVKPFGARMSRAKSPRISIVTAVLNGERHIGEALSSVKAQTYPNIEHIIIDGKSEDGTISIIEKFQNNSIRLISEPDKGIYDALNKGINLSTGDVIGFVHSDDYLANRDVISSIAKRFENPEVEAVFGDLDYVSSGPSRQRLNAPIASAQSGGDLQR